jgi:myo-inositol-1(or 4)-monophosphatase
MDLAPSSSDLLACARAAARRAGDHALRNLHRRGEALSSTRHDVKLRLDVECQEKAFEVIRSAFPRHDVLGEEGGAADGSAGGGGHEWVVDPIDGTVNFSHGLPLWCCSVAVRLGERPLAGAVYAPALREEYSASADGPAVCNDAPLRVSAVTELAAALVHTSLDRRDLTGQRSLALFGAIAGCVQRPRVLGSAALDLCQVASGQADGYFEAGVYVWDVAAAGLIVERAGGTAEALQYHDPRRRHLMYLATNGLLHAAIRDVIDRALRGT